MWEYTYYWWDVDQGEPKLPSAVLKELNRYGQEGWEMVSVATTPKGTQMYRADVTYMAFFKRPNPS